VPADEDKARLVDECERIERHETPIAQAKDDNDYNNNNNKNRRNSKFRNSGGNKKKSTGASFCNHLAACMRQLGSWVCILLGQSGCVAPIRNQAG
jgi:hypothetical protein